MPNNGNSSGWTCLGVLGGVVLLLVLIFAAMYSSLNASFQQVDSAKAMYGSALDNCTQSIKGVWTITDQYMKHEQATLTAVTEARSGFEKAADGFKNAQGSADNQAATAAGKKAVDAAIAFQVQIEAYPNLQAAGVSQSNIKNMEESINQIKTSLDDWIVATRNYNTARGSFSGTIIGGMMPRFPTHINYYEGKTKELNVDELNPQQK